MMVASMNDNYDDPKLIARLKENDFHAQKELLALYASKLTAFVIKLGLLREDAIEVVSQSIQKVIENIDSFESDKGAKFSTWVCKIARNTAIDRIRLLNRELEKTEGPLESIEKLTEEGHIIGIVNYDPLADESIETDDIKYEILRIALNNLNPIDRIVLSEWSYGSSFKSISKLINKKEGTAKVIKLRALGKLRDEYLKILGDRDIIDQRKSRQIMSRFGGNDNE
jgi:RNA polymerase sigma factor (sigma-70 family)